MKHSIVLLFAAATIGLAAPVMASAQPPAFDNHGQSRPGGDLREREARLGDRIDRAEEQRRLSHREARNLRGQLAAVRHDQMRHRASDGVMSDRERRDIDMKLDRLSARIHDQAN
jgi:hypothetical protein